MRNGILRVPRALQKSFSTKERHMKLIYTLQMEDLVAFNQYHFQHSPTFRRNRRIIIGASVIAVCGYVIYDYIQQQSLVSVISGVIAAAIAITILSLLTKSPYKKGIRRLLREGRNTSILGRHELEVTETGITEHTEQISTTIAWKGIERIVSTDSHVFVYLSSTSACIIPRDSIIEGDYEMCLEELRHRMKSS